MLLLPLDRGLSVASGHLPSVWHNHFDHPTEHGAASKVDKHPGAIRQTVEGKCAKSTEKYKNLK
jgi:hypothetical protein